MCIVYRHDSVCLVPRAQVCLESGVRQEQTKKVSVADSSTKVQRDLAPMLSENQCRWVDKKERCLSLGVPPGYWPTPR